MDAALIERGIAASPKSMQSSDLILAVVRKIPYFQEAVKNKSKFHITVGHQTVIGYCLFFTANSEVEEEKKTQEDISFNKAALIAS